MIRLARPFLLLAAALAASLPGSAAPQPARATPDFIRERGPLTAIEHVLVIDGTGAAPRANQTILIDHGRIAAIGPDGSVAIPRGASRIDGRGRTAIPGLVGMHEHMFRTRLGRRPVQRHPGAGHLPAALSRQRRHHRAHRRLGRSARRSRHQARDRGGAADRPRSRSHHALSRRRAAGDRPALSAARPRRGARGGPPLGLARLHLGQGLYEHLAGRARRRDPRGAPPRHARHRPSLLGRL